MAKAGIVYVGTSDGVLIWSDPASIGRWRRVGETLQGSGVRSLLAHSALSVDVAVEGVGVRHSDDGGQTWQAADDTEVSLLAGHPAAPATLFAAAGSDILRSEDTGDHWTTGSVGDRPVERITALIVDIHNAQRLLVGLEQSGIWVSVDGGNQWEVLGAGLPPQVERIVVSPNRPGRVYAVASGGVWRAGEGALWTPVAQPVPVAQGSAMAILPGAEETLLVATRTPDGSFGILRTTNDGDSWQPAPPDEPFAAPVTVIVPATYHIDTAWAGTADGRLLLSDNRGRSWRTIASNLSPITSIAAVRLA